MPKEKSGPKTTLASLGPLAKAVPWTPPNLRIGAGQRMTYNVGRSFVDVLITTNGPFEPLTVDCSRGADGILVLKVGKSTTINRIYLVPS